ncbi:MAG: phosphoribosyl-AMP cyclohydrolase [Candidatus Zipacnadales bacterium]
MAFLDEVKFNEQGLVTAIAVDAVTREVLMVAYMNREALEKTVQTGHATYWSRSRQELWVKGATSGNVQRVVALRRDCDGDAILLEVEQSGAACHEGYRTCFSRKLSEGEWRITEERLCEPY